MGRPDLLRPTNTTEINLNPDLFPWIDIKNG